MSEESEIEVRSVHEELIEEEAKELGFVQKIAMLTAVLSTIGAFLAIRFP
jgi:hypothetical protein